ncbi:Plasmid stabilisation system protein [Anaerostipes hadrus]|nr:Plasmid stabilisation system protein [Anaerostipes hadrus]
MIYEVEVSEQADRDLREIFEYIAFELQSPENAIGQLNRLEEQILSLDAMPKRYRKYEKRRY